MKSLILPEEAQRLILENLPEKPSITCPLDKCAGRILRQAVTSDRPIPPFDRSMMDGYALRTSDIDPDGIFIITHDCPAGSPHIALSAVPKACAEIMTGAILPTGADCVVPYEATQRLDKDKIKLTHPADHAAGDCIHQLGSDHPADAVLIKTGRTISSRETAIAASCGYDTLKVSKQPSIAVVSTGDELVEVSQSPEPHQIRRSNDLMIDVALKRAGFIASERAHINDDAQHCAGELQRLSKANHILIISGGISMGKKDFMPEALNQLGFTCHFHGVAQKPGKPFGFWTSQDCAVFALPGNPISTLTCLHQYVIPALFSTSGQTDTAIRTSVQLTAPVKARDDITIFLPVKKEANNQASPQPINNSGDLVRILESDGYIGLPPTQGKGYEAGKSFDFHPWY
ncbi:MAG: molybdopterin molybdotransferase MoeA [Opitutales bacterium]